MAQLRVRMAEFARMHGVCRQAVDGWKNSGHLVMRGGMVLVEATDRRLADKGLGKFAGLETKPEPAPAAEPTEGEGAKAAGQREAARRSSARSRHYTDEERGVDLDDPESLEAFLDGLISGDYVSQRSAEMIKENALAAKRVLEFQQAAGSLVELAVAEAEFFEQARAIRDAWQNWPARVGPLLAAEFGLPADKFTEALGRHVHDELSRLGEPDAEFAAEPSQAA